MLRWLLFFFHSPLLSFRVRRRPGDGIMYHVYINLYIYIYVFVRRTAGARGMLTSVRDVNKSILLWFGFFSVFFVLVFHERIPTWLRAARYLGPPARTRNIRPFLLCTPNEQVPVLRHCWRARAFRKLVRWRSVSAAATLVVSIRRPAIPAHKDAAAATKTTPDPLNGPAVINDLVVSPERVRHNSFDVLDAIRRQNGQ